MSIGRALTTLGRGVATLVIAVFVGFALLEALPGDPSDRLDDPSVPAEQAARTRAALALDRPAAERFAACLRGSATGELGASFTLHRPVADVLVESLPATALLGSTSLALAYALGLASAFALLVAPARWRVRADALLAAAAALPRFWLGVALVFVFHDGMAWFPASHAAPPGEAGGILSRASHLVLPAATLALPAAAAVARWQLAAAASALAGPRVLVSRALGLSTPRVVWRSVARPNLGPLVALIGLDLPVLVSGAVVVETVFAWPGLGRVAAQSVLAADYPLALGCVLLGSALVVAGGVAADVAADALDVRRRSTP